MSVPRIKICCISSTLEAELAVSFGAAALGLVAEMPSGPGVISDELIAYIASQVPPPVASFLLTSETRVNDIITHHHQTRTNTLQLVDALSEGTHKEIKEQLPAIRVVQVIHVLNEASVEEALAAAEGVDALLLDSGNPSLSVKQLGGTGRTHNWQISRKIVEQVDVPVFLAGGLHVENVRQAIDTVQPFGLDICSGVRTDGKLDPYKLESFFATVYG